VEAGLSAGKLIWGAWANALKLSINPDPTTTERSNALEFMDSAA
jgi:hypothetical protein